MCLELKINTSKCLSDEPIKMPYFENYLAHAILTIILAFRFDTGHFDFYIFRF